MFADVLKILSDPFCHGVLFVKSDMATRHANLEGLTCCIDLQQQCTQSSNRLVGLMLDALYA